jgi:hypothetical protein
VRIKCDDGEDPAGEPADGTGAVGAAGDVGAGCAGGGIGLGSGCWARTAGAKNKVIAIAEKNNQDFVDDANRFFLAMSSPVRYWPTTKSVPSR